MNKKMIAGIIVAFVLGLGAVFSVAVGGLWSSMRHAQQPAKPVTATLLTKPVVRPGDEATLKAAVAKAPADATALTKLADFYAAQRAFPSAIDLYRKAVAADPNDAAAWSGMGEAYVQTVPSTQAALPPQARDAFVHAIAINGNELRSRFYMAMEKDFLGHHDEAINDWIYMLGIVPMGSQADNAIRAALVGSMGRSATILRHRVEAATMLQKKLPKQPVS